MLAVAANALAVSSSAAQSATTSPGFDPLQAEKRFDRWQAEQGRSGPPVQTPTLHGSVGPASTTPLFVLRRVTIEGAHAVPAADIAAVYRPYLGRKVSQADLAAIAGGISDLYRAAGFHLSRAIVPPQDIDGGRIRVQVIEGAIDEVRIEGGEADRFGVATMFASVRAERPSRLATLERQLTLINDRPGLRITDTTLEEIGTASGHFRLKITVRTWTGFASYGFDNLGSAAVGPWQGYATAGLNSLGRPGDSLMVNLATVPTEPNDLNFVRATYDVPVGFDGFRIGASAMSSTVRPSDYRRDLHDITRTESIDFHASLAAIAKQREALTFTVAATALNSSETDMFGPIYNDYIRTVSFLADYRLRDDLNGTTYLTGNWRQGLPMFGAVGLENSWTSRAGAPANFGVFDFWASRIQTLPGDFSLKLAGAAQVATAPLFLSQQYYIGGASFGRGYGNAEVSGDNALAATAELRYDRTVDFAAVKSVQLYSFVDTGTVWNFGYAIRDGASLTSVGGGIRFYLPNNLRADIGVGVPLTYAARDNPDRSPRLLFSLSQSFRMCPERASMVCL